MSPTFVGIMNTALYILCFVAGSTIIYLTASGKIQDDSVPEELVEVVIEAVTGEDIDLTPHSDEKD